MKSANDIAKSILGKALVDAMGGISHITITPANLPKGYAGLTCGDTMTFYFNEDETVPKRQFVVTSLDK